MNDTLRQFRDFFVSLRLTVVLLVLSMLLVFAATLDQVNLGVWAVQEKYFHSLFVLWRIPNTSVPIPVFPGGYLIGGFLLVNLIAAHVYRFKLTWRKSGIFLTHVGLILLLVGELLAGLWQQEFQLQFHEGETKNYSESYRYNELAITDTTDPKFDDVVAVPEQLLVNSMPVQHPKLPFRVVTKEYLPNAALRMRTAADAATPSPATMGIGQQVAVTPLPLTYKQDERNWPAAYVELIGPEGSLGTWLVSPELGAAQTFDYGGRTWRIGLRFERDYKPFSLTLLKVTHDIYPGTDIPKNFASRIKLATPDGHDDREVLIYMNNPFRYAGLTFYQYQMDSEHATSVLQVVRNPSWRIPYISCAMIALGLIIQFCIHLFGFIGKRRGSRAVPAPTKLLIPLLTLGLGLALVARSLLPPSNPDAFDVVGFSRLPVLMNGRTKPMDTVARTSLLVLCGDLSNDPANSDSRRSRRIATPDNRLLTPNEWFLDLMFDSGKADTYQVITIDNLDVLSLFHLQPEDGLAKRRFSFAQIQKYLPELERQARLAEPVESQARNAFQRSVVQLQSNVVLYLRLRDSLVASDSSDFLGDLMDFQKNLPAGVEAVRNKEAKKPYDAAAARQLIASGERFDHMSQLGYILAVPPASGESDTNGWKNVGAALMETFQTGAVNPHVMAYAGLAHTWRAGKATEFNEIIRLYRAELQNGFSTALSKCDIETHYNSARPFYTAKMLYVVAFFLALLSWLRWPRELGRGAFWLVALAWAVTTAGILMRMWLEGRPPVTNLYSSALFVGWVAVAFCLVLEYLYRNAIGSVAAGLIGFGTLLIASYLELGGDTLEMMRAVLDSNFWLSTHVLTVVAGYGATYLAGFLALIYIVRGLVTKSLDRPTADALGRMVYGIVCFATLFSFIGTVLGGIWADQSWGRFWGWDPKENGALIIVMWNAIVLHARWGGLIRQRGLMCLAVGGNIVTSWSWFGVNLLGVGLHNYGFVEATFWWLILFVVSQLLFIAAANLPLDKWRSFAAVRK